MALKEKIFAIFLVLIIFFPFFFSKKEIKLEENQKITLPNVIIQKGSFKEFNHTLQKEGSFEKLSYFNENYYVIENLKMKIINKKNEFFAKQAIFKNKIIEAERIHYIIKGVK